MTTNLSHLFFNKIKLWHILIVALFFRLLAAMFAIGYGMHDDHFCVIEPAQGWVDGQNIGNWLPENREGFTPVIMYSFFYPGIHFLLFSIMKSLNINDPQIKMFLIRLLHAFYSLGVIYFGYKITEKISDKHKVLACAALLGLLWFTPNLSVRNLTEVVCTVPLLSGLYFLIKEKSINLSSALWSGFIMGFAFSIRFQTALFIGGIGLVLLYKKQLKLMLLFAIGVALNIFLFQCIADIWFWKKPLAVFLGYVEYNLQNKGNFISGSWYNYPLLISGLVLPPISILFWISYFKTARKYLLLFVPSFLFLVFHCSFENKQERFILTFIPFFIIQGCASYDIVWPFIQNHPTIKNSVKVALYFIIVINGLLLFATSFAATHVSRMNAMSYIYTQKDVRSYLIDATYKDGWEFFPRFYLGSWCPEYLLTKSWNVFQWKENFPGDKKLPNYAIFVSEQNLSARVDQLKEIFPAAYQVASIQPSWVDKLFHRLNPVNKNEPCFIYKLE